MFYHRSYHYEVTSHGSCRASYISLSSFCSMISLGETRSEGGFAPNRVSAASILDVAAITDKKGKEYYTYNILTRTGEKIWCD